MTYFASMDNLALNIFVPEERKPKIHKQKKSPTQTVVKSSSKNRKVVKKSLEKGSTKSVKGTANAKPVKPNFIKSKAGKTVSAAEPFLVSQNFKKSDQEKLEKQASGDPDEEEGFSVKFVKPKLFCTKQNPSKLQKSIPESSVLKQRSGHKDSHARKREESGVDPATSKQGGNVNSKHAVDPSATVDSNHSDLPAQNTVDFTVPTKRQQSQNEEKRQRRSSNVFAPQTFSKWAVNPAGAAKKVRVDFSVGTGVVKNPASMAGSTLKRKIDSMDSKLDLKRRKEDAGLANSVEDESIDKNNQRKMGNKTNAKRISGTNVNKMEKAQPNLVTTTGPISSLFNAAPELEKLEDQDVEPIEERLFSRKQFADIGVHPHLVGNLEQLFSITKMTVVQKKTIPILMLGKDGLVRSQTGSGKTLAYAIPIMHSLAELKPQLTRKDGVKALVVLPTRELALQTYECFTKLMRAFTWIVPGIVVGGEKRKSEKNRLRKGITVLIGTPGRLLDHAEHTDNLSLHGIDWLVIDEADKLLEMGYEKDISSLMAIIDGQREKADNVGRKQTVLLSATLTSSVEWLANLALKDPVRIDACGDAVMEDVLVIPSSLQQKYVVVPAKMRLVALASFLIDVAEFKKSNKILVFMATQDMVDYYLELLQGVLSSSVKFYKLHGNMSQTDRTEVFNRFRSSDKGVLLSTDVAARGLDLPKVDWIVQFTAPTTPAEYVHRVGRTARVGTEGSALLFLLPSELHFVSMLNSSRIKMGEASLDQYLKSLMKIHLESKDGQRWGGGVEGAATVLQHNFEHSVLEDPALHELAAKAYKSWVRFYATYPKDLRAVFDFKSLHLGHNAKSFALRDPPKAIGGIGKPKKGDKAQRAGKTRKDDRRKRKPEGLGHVTAGSRTKKLILSEFDSGLKPIKKS